MELRKLDYILLYIIIVITFVNQLFEPTMWTVIGIVVCSSVPALILGTISNILFRGK